MTPQWILKDLQQSNIDWGCAHQMLPAMIKQFVAMPQSGAEIGVAYGSMACSLLKQIPTLNMLCVDPYRPYDPMDGMTLDNERHEELYVFTRDRLESEYPARAVLARMTSEEACAMAKDESLDFVFIDACHQYDAVKKDISIWQHKVKKGGVISGHDYATAWVGVTKAVNEYCTEVQKPIIHHAQSAIWAIIK